MSWGRPAHRYPVELAYKIDMARLRRDGWLVPGTIMRGRLRWAYPWYEPEAAEISLALVGEPSLTVQFKGEAVQRISLEAVPQRFGGVRWWMRCPLSGRRCRVLYLPNGGRIFASRQAHRLIYRTQQLDAAGRASRRYEKLAEAFEITEEGEILKPRGMRWRTYQREVAKLKEAEAAEEAYFLERVSRVPGLAESMADFYG